MNCNKCYSYLVKSSIQLNSNARTTVDNSSLIRLNSDRVDFQKQNQQQDFSNSDKTSCFDLLNQDIDTEQKCKNDGNQLPVYEITEFEKSNGALRTLSNLTKAARDRACLAAFQDNTLELNKYAIAQDSTSKSGKAVTKLCSQANSGQTALELCQKAQKA